MQAAPAKPQKKRKTRDREATRLAFIDAAEALFAEHGFVETTLDMLAARAGANKALVSYYFGGKEGLYDAVIARLVDEMLADVRLRLQEDDDPVETFRRYVRALARAFAARPSFPAIVMRAYLSGAVQERERPFRAVLQFYETTERLYAAGRAAGRFCEFDPHKLHLAIIGPLVHFTLTIGFRERTFSRLEGRVENPTVDDFAASVAALILGGLAPDGADKASSSLVD